MEPTGPFAVLYSKLAPYVKKGAKVKLTRQHKFAAIVNAMLQFIEEGSVNINPIPTPKEVTSKKYPHFGGADCGYIVKKKDESDESDDSDESDESAE
jgi:hypothetical protein